MADEGLKAKPRKRDTHWINPDTRFEVNGWAIDRSQPELAVPVQLWVEDRLAAEQPARRYRAGVKKRFGGDGRHGFRFILPLVFYRGGGARCRLVRGDTGEELQSFLAEPADLRLDEGEGGAGSWYGVVTRADEKGVTGWIADDGDHQAVGVVELWVDGARVDRQEARMPLRVLPFDPAEVGHGFAFRLPARFYDGGTHRLSVRAADRAAELVGGGEAVTLPVALQPQLTADLAVDEAGMLRGTVSSIGSEAMPIGLTLFAGERPIGTVAVMSGMPVAIDVVAMAAAAEGGISGGLHVRVEAEGIALAVAGPDPFAGAVVVSSARLTEGTARFALGTRPQLALGVRLAVLADGVPQAERWVTLNGSEPAVVELPVAGTPRQLALVLADGTPLRGASFRVLGHPGSLGDEPLPAPAGEDEEPATPEWVSPGHPAVQLALDARLGGLMGSERNPRLSGAWLLDRAAERIEGWALALGDTVAPLEVELMLGEVAVARAVADRPRVIAPPPLDAPLPVGFSFDLSTLTLDHDAVVALSVQVADGPLLAPQAGVAYSRGQKLIGAVDELRWSDFTLVAGGWVCDLARPNWPVEVVLQLDGADACQVMARQAASVVLPGGGEVQAFRFTLKAFTGEGDIHERVAVLADEGRVPLPLPAIGKADEAGAQPFIVASRSAPPVAPDHEISGNIEAVGTPAVGGVRGWAVDLTDPEAVPDLVLELDRRPLAHTRPRIRRGDVEIKHGGHGYAGFLFETPPNFGWVAPYTISVRAAIGQSEFTRNGKTFPPSVPNALPATLPPWSAAPARLADGGSGGGTVSLILLNQDGAGLLRALFASVLEHEADPRFEWIVVDHLSQDDSAEACAEAARAGLNVRFEPRDANYSFSASNNHGARLASGDELVFVNNDLTLTEAIIGPMLDVLRDPAVGLVGARLMDAMPPVTAVEPPIQHLGVYFNPLLTDRQFRPYEARLTAEVEGTAAGVAEVPAATGALLAMRRADYESIGGFDERYFYGYEDVDLCMKVRRGLGKAVMNLNTAGAVHHRGFTRMDGRHKDPRRRNNSAIFTADWGAELRRMIRGEMLSRPGFWLGHRPTIAFIVTEASDTTAAGDYFTALELGRALQAIAPVHVAFLGRKEWYDLSGIDILVVMVDGFDLNKVQSARAHLQTVAWPRNWFDRWCERTAIHSYDQIWASSEKAAAYMAERLGRAVEVVRIATNPDALAGAEPDPELASDYCFTGSRFGVARALEFSLKPAKIVGRGAIFGHNWKNHSVFSAIDRGAVAYSAMPGVYASTAVVLDDANIATRRWASCNSRVFDAVAAGRLVLSNGEEGAREVFGDLLPAWTDEESLTDALNWWLAHPQERAERAAALREIVLAEHTYAHRARQVLDLLSNSPAPLKFAIKTAAVTGREHEWGDYHYAVALAEALRAAGCRARIDVREAWYGGLCDTDDAVIVLRGVAPYVPAAHQINLMWIISHPDDIPISELAAYEHVYVASSPHAAVLAAQTATPVDVMLQCTDPARFNPDLPDLGVPGSDLLFVGNSRNVEREVVRWSIAAGLDLSLYGGGWANFVPPGVLKGAYVPNEILGTLYRKARWVLCDHWVDMRRQGFISNRVFDVLAAGGNLIVDDVVGLEDVVPDGFRIYRTREDLAAIAGEAPVPSAEERRRRAEWVIEHHSFAARAAVFIAEVEAKRAAASRAMAAPSARASAQAR